MTSLYLHVPGAYLSALLPYMSTEETRYYLNGVHVCVRNDSLRLAATDGHSLLILRTMNGDWPDAVAPKWLREEGFIIAGAKLAEELKCIPAKRLRDPVPLTFEHNGATGNDAAVKLVDTARDHVYPMEFVEATFPDIQRVVPRFDTDDTVHRPHCAGFALAQMDLVTKTVRTLSDIPSKPRTPRFWWPSIAGNPLVIDFPCLPGAIIVVMPFRVNEDALPLNVAMTRSPDDEDRTRAAVETIHRARR